MTGSEVLFPMLRRLLRPLVRLLVQQQIQYPLISQILKSLFVEVAAEDFSIEGKRLTVSRLSLLTGIHRREVKRIQAEGALGEAKAPKAITLGAQIVERWTGEAPWLDEAGRPRRLPRTKGDERPTFQKLVNSVSVDIHPRSVLDEWIRMGVASIDGEGAVVLNVNAFVPSRGFEEKAYFVGRNLRDHLSAACGNLVEDDSPFLERSVYYASLPREAVEELSALAKEVGQEMLVRVNERARKLKQAVDEGGDDEARNRRRFTFGVYLYDALSKDETAADKPAQEMQGDSHAD